MKWEEGVVGGAGGVGAHESGADVIKVHGTHV